MSVARFAINIHEAKASRCFYVANHVQPTQCVTVTSHIRPAYAFVTSQNTTHF